jgi:hypothetical protein
MGTRRSGGEIRIESGLFERLALAMRILAHGVCLLFLLCSPVCLQADSAKILKVLPHYLDEEGRHSLSPSLYERDAYQAFLRANPDKRSALRFDVNWKVRNAKNAPVILRLELRGSGQDLLKPLVLEKPVKPHFFSRWSSLKLEADDYTNFGQLVAWRATLWEGSELRAEQKSFLW